MQNAECRMIFKFQFVELSIDRNRRERPMCRSGKCTTNGRERHAGRSLQVKTFLIKFSIFHCLRPTFCPTTATWAFLPASTACDCLNDNPKSGGGNFTPSTIKKSFPFILSTSYSSNQGSTKES